MISFVIPVLETDPEFWSRMEFLEKTTEIQGFNDFEIIVVPNGIGESVKVPSKLKHTRSLIRNQLPGKGLALKVGFEEALGEAVFMIDADLPYELDFISKAMKQLTEDGSDLVYSNRRHPESFFRVKIPTLHLAFRRHCFGLLFNKMARLILGIKSKDTQAGMKLLSKRLAKNVARLATCPGFLFDLEIFVIAQSNEWKISDLPVVFNLEHEKSSVRLFNETFAIFTWLPKIRLNLARKKYQPALSSATILQPV